MLTATENGVEGPPSEEVSATAGNGIGLSPESSGVADTALEVNVRVGSVYQMVSVTAMSEGRAAQLSHDDFHDLWRATISLAGLPSPRTRTVTFTVTDIQGTTATASQTFEHNRVAIIVIESPKPDAVALPQLRLRASCVDDVPLGCNGFEVILAESERIAGDQGIDQDVSLATFDGRLEDLSIDGRLVFISPANGLAPRRYLWTPGGSATEVGSGLGRPKFIE